MLYAILCYNREEVTEAWSKDQDEKVMKQLGEVEAKLARAGKLGPVVRLLPTSAATTLRKGGAEPIVLDGPFAETKEQLLGFFVVDCVNLDDAIDAATELAVANPGVGAYELRPIAIYKPSANPIAALVPARVPGGSS